MDIKGIKKRHLAGFFLVVISVVNYYIPSFRIISKIDSTTLSAFLLLVGILLIKPFYSISNFIYDNHDYERVFTIDKFLSKIRYRALLFNNLSVVIFVFTFFVILTGFYLLVYPPINSSVKEADIPQTSLTVRIGASTLLIFLVQILFRVFKYLLRIAAFYNAKADAIEFSEIEEVTPKMDLEKLMPLFTPDQYDISDLPQPTLPGK